MLLLVCLIIAAPARLLLYVLPANEVIMQGFSGTLWRGQANRVLVATGSGYIQLGRVRWSLNPLSALTLSPSGRLDSEWGKQKLSTDLQITGSQSVEFENLDGLTTDPVTLLPEKYRARTGEFDQQRQHQ